MAKNQNKLNHWNSLGRIEEFWWEQQLFSTLLFVMNLCWISHNTFEFLIERPSSNWLITLRYFTSNLNFLPQNVSLSCGVSHQHTVRFSQICFTVKQFVCLFVCLNQGYTISKQSLYSGPINHTHILHFSVIFCLDFKIPLSLDFSIPLCLEFKILLYLDSKILSCLDFKILLCLDGVLIAA